MSVWNTCQGTQKESCPRVQMAIGRWILVSAVAKATQPLNPTWPAQKTKQERNKSSASQREILAHHWRMLLLLLLSPSVVSDSVRPHRQQPTSSPIPGILQATTLEWVAISFSNAWKWKVKVKSLSHVRLLATPWTAAYQAPLSMGFSRREYWSGVPLPSPLKSLAFTKYQFLVMALIPAVVLVAFNGRFTWQNQ